MSPTRAAAAPAPNNWVGHGGGSVGGSTDLRIYPDGEVVVAVISNLSDVRYGELAQQLRDLFAE